MNSFGMKDEIDSAYQMMCESNNETVVSVYIKGAVLTDEEVSKLLHDMRNFSDSDVLAFIFGENIVFKQVQELKRTYTDGPYEAWSEFDTSYYFDIHGEFDKIDGPMLYTSNREATQPEYGSSTYEYIGNFDIEIPMHTDYLTESDDPGMVELGNKILTTPDVNYREGVFDIWLLDVAVETPDEFNEYLSTYKY